jgi:hypothetical protein
MEKTWRPTTAGILTIIAGAIGMGRGGFMLALGGVIGKLTGVSAELSDLMSEWVGAFVPGTVDIPLLITNIISISSTVLTVIGIVSLAFGIVSLVGGIQAIRRKAWGLALAGSILAIPASAVLGILAIIFVSTGKREFA